MQLFVEHSDYTHNPAVDINPEKLNGYDQVLVVTAREGQKKRLQHLATLGLHHADVVGWWDLSGLSTEILYKFEAVFILDPERIGDINAQAQWNRIIECHS